MTLAREYALVTSLLTPLPRSPVLRAVLLAWEAEVLRRRRLLPQA